MTVLEPDELEHIGTPRHSGRYPWGSGKNPYQRGASFMARYKELQKAGMSQTEIAEAMGFKSTTELRARKSIASGEKQKYEVSMANKLKQKGYSNVAIAKRLGITEGTVRNYIKEPDKIRADAVRTAADALKEQVEKSGMVDVGKGTNIYLGVSETRKNNALEVLKQEGYGVYKLDVKNSKDGKNTTLMVLTKPGMTWREMYNNRYDIKPIVDISVSDDGHGEVQRIRPIENIDRKRVYVRYAEDGGADKDGTIELRRGVKDLDMGGALYSQVRIGVDGDKYMKGMAFYSDDIPDGYDVIYNSNKSRGASDDKVFKPQKDDPMNPFGAVIKPGGQRGVLNIMREEGDWSDWSRNIPAQMLSKQPDELARQQLKITKDIKQSQFEEVMSITNPTIRKSKLLDFADQCDSDAVHLQAAAMPRQSVNVILPVTSLKDNEIYAPNYKDGERVVLIRFPHGGKFEIPELIVNNKNKEAKSFMQNAKDAVGINSKVASVLSGADFDGDFALVLPNNSGSIKTAPPLKGLENFDPKVSYAQKEGQRPGWEKGSTREHTQMGIVSNLITDMHLKGASDEELARAVRHSMVIIDTGKHKLDWESSEKENNIAELKKLYQGRATGGAGTLISRSKHEIDVAVRKDRYDIDPDTGEKIFTELSDYKRTKSGEIMRDKNGNPILNPSKFKKTKTGEFKLDKNGNPIAKTQKSAWMYEAKDAKELLSDDPTTMELIYADYANYMKSLGNKARKEYLRVQENNINPEAKKKYAEQVSSLNAKLNTALKNAPLERKANLVADQYVNQVRADNPDMSYDEIKKERGKALTRARQQVGAKKKRIYIEDDEWEAIQSNAITKTKLKAILDNADSDRVLELSMPKKDDNIPPSQIASIKSMLARGYTQAEIAEAYGISTNTVAKYA